MNTCYLMTRYTSVCKVTGLCPGYLGLQKDGLFVCWLMFLLLLNLTAVFSPQPVLLHPFTNGFTAFLCSLFLWMTVSLGS